MRKLALALVALIGFQFSSVPAEANPHWTSELSGATDMSGPSFSSGRVARGRNGTRNRVSRSRRDGSETGYSSMASLTGGSGIGPRPRKWCGWWMRTQLGGGPAFNLAWNWRHYGSPTTPQVGAVVVWRHHVGIITGQAGNGQWVVKSGNDGGRVRERARSVSGAIFRI
jgi:hypothetical protein